LATNRGWFTRVRRLPEEIGLLVILLGLCLCVSILSPYFFTFDNVINILLDISVTGIAAIGMTYVMIAGSIDLSVGSTLALSATLAASFLGGGRPIALAVAVALMVGLAIGVINGLAVTVLRIPSLIATLAMLSMARGAELMYGKAVTIFGFGDAFGTLGRGTIGPIPNPVVLTLSLFVITSIVLARTPFGRKIYAVGGSPRAARVVGIPVPRITIAVFIISGMLAALAGLVLISQLDSAPAILGTNLELQAITAVVIGGTSLTGGKGGVWGTLIGVTLIGVITNSLNLLNVSPYYQQLIQGAVLFIAVAIDMARRGRPSW